LANWIKVPHVGCKVQVEDGVVIAIQHGNKTVHLRQVIFPSNHTHVPRGMTGVVHCIPHPHTIRQGGKLTIQIDFGSRRIRTVPLDDFSLEKPVD